MKSNLAILLWAPGPDVPHLCAAPFSYAAAAAAMDVEVEIHFSSKSVLLLVPGIAAALYAGSSREMSIYQHLRQATQYGAKLYACSNALAAQDLEPGKLVPETTGIAGAAAFLARVLDPEWSTLVF